jgi:hypothetical protein
MENIENAVGFRSSSTVKNNWKDVGTVQTLLKLAAIKTDNRDYHLGLADGIILPFFSRTVDCIKAFQSRFMRHPDGVVSPGCRTLRALSRFATISTPLQVTKGVTTLMVNALGCCFLLARLPSNSYQKPVNRKDYRGTYFGARRYRDFWKSNMPQL